ncbi:MAG: lipoprotein-releasing ABC transporter permease subunit [Gammaproteobacteria bacterium]
MSWFARSLARLLPLWIAVRYLQARRRNRYFSFVSLVSIGGLVLGVAVLTLVLSVMNGFDRELKRRILGAVPHIVVTGAGVLDDWERVAQRLQEHPEVIGAAPFVEAEAMLASGGVVVVASLYGIDPRREAPLTIVDEHMVYGSFDDLDPMEAGVIIGAPMAFRLGLTVGDPVALVIPTAEGEGESVAPRLVRATLVGTFQLDSEIDHGLALMHIDVLRALGLSSGKRSGVRLAVRDLLQARAIAEDLTGLVPNYVVRDWGARYGELFRTVDMEKGLMFLLLAVVIAIATFNIVSSLVMLVEDKQGDIAILRTMGLKRGELMRVFAIQGTLIGIVGVVAGLGLGYLLALSITDVVAFFERLTGSHVLAGTYFDEVPSEIEKGDLVWVGVLGFALSLLATIHPSRRALEVNPAVALHRE